MAAEVMIGIDPHKESRTATAINRSEQVVAMVRVRPSGTGGQRLLEWGQTGLERTWAVKNATSLGHLLP